MYPLLSASEDFDFPFSAMRIKGLYPSIWQGEEEVFFHGTPCPLLQECYLCETYHHTYFFCVNGHITCTACQLRAKAKLDQAPCRTCKNPAFKIVVPQKLLEKIDFNCGCGRVGTLGDIQNHRCSIEAEDECGEEPFEQEDQIFIDRKSELNECRMVLNSISRDLTLKLDHLAKIAANHGLEIVEFDALKRVRKEIKDLQDESEDALKEFREISDEHQQLGVILGALISPESVRTFSVSFIVRKSGESKAFTSPIVRVLISLAVKHDGNADLYIEVKPRRGYRHLRQLVGKFIVVRHHDLDGYALNETSFQIQLDGTIGRDGPDDIHEAFPTYRKVANFVDRTRLFGPEARISDKIPISFELH